MRSDSHTAHTASGLYIIHAVRGIMSGEARTASIYSPQPHPLFAAKGFL